MELANVSWKKFFVIVAGQTNGAHGEIVANLESIGQTEEHRAESSDYLLVFCPAASRVGTDIAGALRNLPGGKQIILVVMHHTFNPDYVVADSRRLVDNPNVLLTVDCFFYNDSLLTCPQNDTAWDKVQRFLGVSGSLVSKSQAVWNCIKRFCGDWKLMAGLAGDLVGILVVVIVTLVVVLNKK